MTTTAIYGATEVTLGEYLRLLRQRANMSMSDLAEKSGINRNTIGRFEADSENCTLETIQALFAVFGLVLDIRFKEKP